MWLLFKVLSGPSKHTIAVPVSGPSKLSVVFVSVSVRS